MTLTFNPDKYKKLLTAYLPKLIKNEVENEQALEIVEDLMHRERTPEEDKLYQLLRDFQRINYSKKKKRQVDLKNDNHFKGEKKACRRQAFFSPSFMHEESIHLLSALKLNSANKGYFRGK